MLADLKRGRSPRAIAGRLGAEADGALGAPMGSPEGHALRVSHEAVYTYVYAMPRSELIKHGIRLDSKRTRRRPRKPAGQRQGPIIGMTSIDERPEEVDDRKVPGSWEGDLIIGKNGATAAATLVERTTRFLSLLALPLGRGSESVADAVIAHTAALPEMFRKTLTWDQGIEMARHAHIAQAADIKIFFAHPHSPWERGTNEQTNRMIRRYIPKSTPITDHQPYLNAIAEELNEIPREVLDWRTPREAHEQLLTSSVATTT